MTVTVKELTVKVTCRVGLGNLKMPKNVKDQLIEAAENIDEIGISGTSEYEYARDWLVKNIKESDSMDWDAEIEEIE